MDKIKLNRIELNGSIGVLETEKAGVQPYWISVEIGLDLSRAGRSDRLEDTIDYAAVYELCREVMDEGGLELLEAYAEKVASALLERFACAKQVSVETLKPEAPIEGVFESVGIEITRTRDD